MPFSLRRLPRLPTHVSAVSPWRTALSHDRRTDEGKLAFTGPAFGAFEVRPSTETISSPVFGGQLGYNLQTGNWVWGIETNVDGANMRVTRNISMPAGLFAPFPSGTAFFNEKQKWLADLHGKIGYTWGPGMVYGAFGMAWTGLQIDVGATLFGAPPVNGAFTTDTIRRGTVMGLGYEWMIAPNWSARAEYLHYQFTGAVITSTTFPAIATTFNSAGGKTSNDVVRVGLDYRFDWGAPAGTRY